jgi:hypothetical protein
MPVSAARKFELVGALRGVDVELLHGAVPLEQVEADGILDDPAKTLDGLEDGVRGAKSYEIQRGLFREFAGQYPVEIRAFESRHPAAFKTELEEPSSSTSTTISLQGEQWIQAMDVLR